MAKDKTNKSQLIRDYLTANKGKSPKEISALIAAEKGIEIPPTYVSTIKTSMKTKKKAKKLVKQVAGRSGDASDDRGALFAAAQLVVTAGGIENARAALDAVAKVAAIVA